MLQKTHQQNIQNVLTSPATALHNAVIQQTFQKQTCKFRLQITTIPQNTKLLILSKFSKNAI